LKSLLIAAAQTGRYHTTKGEIDMIGQLLTGRYLILEKLGVGGFSETYLARDKYLPRHPLCVVKYLKLSSSNEISPEVAQQLFENEARLLERLGRDYAQIPTLFAYCHEQEQMYLVQEYVEGENLDSYLAGGKRLTSKAAIALLLDLLPVLDYIHSHRVVHGDIKPSNLIRRRRDGRVFLIDFGVACLLPETQSSAKLDGEANSLVMGTPGYMADEQHQGISQSNSDLYSLGILIIHLLTRVHPRQFQQNPISGNLDWQPHLGKQILEPKLIKILDHLVQPQCRDRYQQASEVLADLKALPKTTSLQQWWKSSKWQKLTSQLAVPMAAMLIMGGLGAQYFSSHSKQATSLISQLKQALPQSNNQLTMLRDLPVQSEVDRLVIAPNNQILVTAGSNHVLSLWSLPNGTLLKSLSSQVGKVTTLTISKNSKFLASGSEDGTVQVWNIDSGQLLHTFGGHQKSVTAVAISADARKLVSGSEDGTLRCWDLQTGIRQRTLKIPGAAVTAVTYGIAPGSLISASSDRQLQVWNLRTGQLQRTFAGHTKAIVDLEVANDHTLFSFGEDRGLVWDLDREELVLALPEDSAKSVTASLNDRTIVTVNSNGNIRVWVRKAGQLVPKKAGTLSRNLDVALSPNHHYLANWSADQRLRIWQINASNIQ